MSLMSTREHLKYVKGRAGQLKGTVGKEMAFCLLRRKGSKDVLVHFDKASQVAKYKNPTTIHRILKKTVAFKFAEDRSFFSDVTKLESMTGLAKHDEDAGLVFTKMKGRASEETLALGLRLLKVKGYTFEASATSALVDDAIPDELLAPLTAMAGAVSTSADITADPGRYFSSMSEMIEAIEALRYTTDPGLKNLRSTLSRAYEKLSDWSDEGIEPVSDALTALAGDDDFTEELADLEEAEALALEEVMVELQSIRVESAALLSQKGAGGHFKSLIDSGKLLKSIKQGHFRLAKNTVKELGGQPVMLVSATSSFDDEQLTMLRESTKTTLIEGTFKKSKSGKKIAIVSSSVGVSRTLFKKLFASLGMALDPYIVKDFENLQTQLRGLKEAAAREDLLDKIATSASVKALDLATVLGNPELLDAMTRFSIDQSTVESVGFLVVAEGHTPPPSLPDDYQVRGSQSIFDAYLAESAPKGVNINSATRRTLIDLAEAGAYSEMDFTDAVTQVTGMLRKNVLPRFRASTILHEAISDSEPLTTLFGID